MAGIYIHIPFCKQKCSYCDFHFSTELKYVQNMLETMHTELDQRIHELEDQQIETIYFGGGTPSIVGSSHIQSFIDRIRAHSNVLPEAEISLEANPDDMSAENLQAWKTAGVNRLSIGVQSFDDSLLTSMNRSHDADQALKSIALAKEMGFDSLSVDIIFGLPLEGLVPFEAVVDRFLTLEVDHISAYSLTLEKGTVYHHRLKKGDLVLPEEEEVERQFIYLIERLARAGYEQYEVSNFARQGHISRHNSAYWKGNHYLGIGPSAHSFDGNSRRWNLSNNHRYMALLQKGEEYWESEEITERTALNEYLLTRSRTKWGLDLNHLKREFNMDLLVDQAAVLKNYEGKYEIRNDILTLNGKGLLLADRFASDLFLV